MITLRISADVPNNRQLTLSLPPDVPTGPAELVVTVQSHNADRERERAEALDRFLALARSSSFRSAGPYPPRAELYERH